VVRQKAESYDVATVCWKGIGVSFEFSANPKQFGLFGRNRKERVLSDELAIDCCSRLYVLSKTVVRAELKSTS
jgi:hypothetical protein